MPVMAIMELKEIVTPRFKKEQHGHGGHH
jgi:hypothetical protein